MKLRIRNTSSQYPETVYRFKLIDIGYSRQRLVWSIHIEICNIMVKLYHTKPVPKELTMCDECYNCLIDCKCK